MKPQKIGPVTLMKAELGETQSEAKKLRTDYLHSLAEFENFRRRKDRELSEFREFANENLLKELVPVLDNFERALKASGDAADKSDAGEQGICKGVLLIQRQLQDVLGRFGFSAYSALGEIFDPRKCEAVGFVEMDDKPEGTVIAESASGYMYKTRVLRPAVVIVAKAKSREPEAAADEA